VAIATLRALRHRNYRLFFSGQFFSLTGTWIQSIAMSWLVYRLSGSAFLLGLTGFASQIPILLFAPFGGFWSDLVNRRRLLLLTQTLSALQAFTLATLTFTGVIRVWQIVLLAGALGLISAFDTPVRQAFTATLVTHKQDLANAIALNSFIFNSARLIGPSIAGLLIAAVGEAVCFLVNGLSYLGVIAVLYRLRIDQPHGAARRSKLLDGLKEGFRYAFGFAPIRAMLILLALVSFTTTPYLFLMPIFAREVFHGTAQVLGVLIGAAGLGAVSGTLYLASRQRVRGLGRIIAVGSATAGIALMLFSLSRVLWLSALLMVFVGAGIIVTAASVNTILQTVVDDDKRGRVMSLYTMSFLGMSPVGSLAAGQLAHLIGAPDTLLAGGACCLAGAALFAGRLGRIRESMRPLYLRRGIEIS
jgi:MFS family permease